MKISVKIYSHGAIDFIMVKILICPGLEKNPQPLNCLKYNISTGCNIFGIVRGTLYKEKAEGIAALRFSTLFLLYVVTMVYMFRIIQFLEPSWRWPLS